MTDFLPGCEPDVDHDRLREHEADFTPPAVARQLWRAALDVVDWNGRCEGSVLFPSAGNGVWIREMPASVDADPIIAVDIRPEERAVLSTLADEVHIGDFLTMDLPEVDLVVDNIPFSLMPEFVDRGLELSPDVWVFAPIDAVSRGADKVEWMQKRRLELDWQLVVTGALKFRQGNNPKTGKPYGSDFRTYALWMFSRAHIQKRPEHRCIQLPMLRSHERAWPGRAPEVG